MVSGVMKILILSWNFPPTTGGIEYVVKHIFDGLRRRGHEVDVVTSFAEVAAEEHVFRAPRKGLFEYVRYAFSKGWKLCRESKPDVILCGTVVAALPALVLSLFHRRPYVVLVHGSDLLHPGRLYQAATTFLLRSAATVCANSRQTQLLLETKGIGSGRIEVVYPGVESARFEKKPEKGAEKILEEIRGRKALLSVGRLVKRKGILEFVERVMPELVRKHPEIVFLVVGEDAIDSLIHREKMKEQIARKAQELHLENHVRLLGRLSDEDLLPLYFRAEVFVLPCLELPDDVEGFGIVFSEAALAGLPIVATRVGGIPDAVDDGKTGILVSAGDYHGLASAILRLLGSEGLRAQMAKTAAARARELFDWDVITKRYEEVLTAITQRR